MVDGANDPLPRRIISWMVGTGQQQFQHLLERVRGLRKWAEWEIGRACEMRRHWPEGVGFLRTELEVGLGFSRIALTASDREKGIRNTANAKLAYDTALHFLDRVALTPAESEELDAKFTQLKAALHKLVRPAPRKKPGNSFR